MRRKALKSACACVQCAMVLLMFFFVFVFCFFSSASRVCAAVSMGGFAARKALRVVSHVEYVVAIELLCACQAIDLLRPLKTTPPLEAVWSLVRSKVAPWKEDRFMSPDIEKVAQMVREGSVWEVVREHIKPEFHSLA